MCLSWFRTFHRDIGEFQTQFSPLFRILATTNNDQGIIQDKKNSALPEFATE